MLRTGANVQLRLVTVGKVREGYVRLACEDFAKRLAPYFPVDVVEVRASAGSDPLRAQSEEAERILKALHEDECVWLLDRTGDEISSEELSRAIATAGNAGTRRMVFIIAGTFGAAGALRERADFVWSLSKLTLLHEWARAVVLEQLYRAAKIARNEPYHH